MTNGVEYVLREHCNEKHKELLAAVNGLNNRLYKDNGKRSIQSILNSHDTAIKFLLWIMSILTVAAVAAAVKLIFFGTAGLL